MEILSFGISDVLLPEINTSNQMEYSYLLDGHERNVVSIADTQGLMFA